MASQKTRALIIRTTDYSETSQVLSVYTRDFGRISLLAKGSKRKRAGSEGPLDVFQVMDIVFLEKSGTHGSSPLHLLTDRKLVEDYHGLRRNLERDLSCRRHHESRRHEFRIHHSHIRHAGRLSTH